MDPARQLELLQQQQTLIQALYATEKALQSQGDPAAIANLSSNGELTTIVNMLAQQQQQQQAGLAAAAAAAAGGVAGAGTPGQMMGAGPMAGGGQEGLVGLSMAAGGSLPAMGAVGPMGLGGAQGHQHLQQQMQGAGPPVHPGSMVHPGASSMGDPFAGAGGVPPIDPFAAGGLFSGAGPRFGAPMGGAPAAHQQQQFPHHDDPMMGEVFGGGPPAPPSSGGPSAAVGAPWGGHQGAGGQFSPSGMNSSVGNSSLLPPERSDGRVPAGSAGHQQNNSSRRDHIRDHDNRGPHWNHDNRGGARESRNDRVAYSKFTAPRFSDERRPRVDSRGRGKQHHPPAYGPPPTTTPAVDLARPKYSSAAGAPLFSTGGKNQRADANSGAGQHQLFTTGGGKGKGGGGMAAPRPPPPPTRTAPPRDGAPPSRNKSGLFPSRNESSFDLRAKNPRASPRENHHSRDGGGHPPRDHHQRRQPQPPPNNASGQPQLLFPPGDMRGSGRGKDGGERFLDPAAALIQQQQQMLALLVMDTTDTASRAASAAADDDQVMTVGGVVKKTGSVASPDEGISQVAMLQQMQQMMGGEGNKTRERSRGRGGGHTKNREEGGEEKQDMTPEQMAACMQMMMAGGGMMGAASGPSPPNPLKPLSHGNKGKGKGSLNNRGTLPDGCKRLFLGGLATETVDGDICRHFSQFGPVEEGCVVRERATGRSRYFGFVRFFKVEDAFKAFHFPEAHVIAGRSIDVKAAPQRPGDPEPEEINKGPRGGGDRVYQRRGYQSARSRSRSRARSREFDRLRRGGSAAVEGGAAVRQDSRGRGRSRSPRGGRSRSRSSGKAAPAEPEEPAPKEDGTAARREFRVKTAQRVATLDDLPVLSEFQNPPGIADAELADSPESVVASPESDDGTKGTNPFTEQESIDGNPVLVVAAPENDVLAVPPSPLASWDEMVAKTLISPALKDKLEAEGLEQPSLVQRHCAPIVDAGYDLVCSAQTGSGKTFAFLIPIVARLMRMRADGTTPQRVWFETLQQAQPLVLILSPTRELTVQTHKEINSILTGDLYAVVCYGGERARIQLEDIYKQVDILSGTPGRLLDFIDVGRISLSNCQTLVLDEADTMIDMGLAKTVEDIILKRDCMAPEQGRQTLLMSATYPPRIRDEMVSRFLKQDQKHVFLRIGNYEVQGGGVAHIRQILRWCDSEEDKFSWLEEDLREWARGGDCGL